MEDNVWIQADLGEPIGDDAITIYLVRHGETDLNEQDRLRGWLDVDLSDKGKKQAKESASFFDDIDLDAIYCSDLKRAIQTATPIAEETGTKVIQNSDFRPINFGVLQGKPISEIGPEMDEIQEEWKVDPSASIDGGESFSAFQERSIAGLEKIISQANPGDHIALVAHLRNCIFYLAYALNGGKPLKGEDIELLSNVTQDLAAVSTLKYDKKSGRIQVDQQNFVEHLDDSLQSGASLDRKSHCSCCHELQFSALHTLADIVAEHPDYIPKEVLSELAAMTSELKIKEFADVLIDLAGSFDGKPGMEDKAQELRNKATALRQIDDSIQDGDIKIIDMPKSANDWIGQADSDESKNRSGKDISADSFLIGVSSGAGVIKGGGPVAYGPLGVVSAFDVEAGHGFSSVQVNLSGGLSDLVKACGEAIPDEDIHQPRDGRPGGREGGPHITARLGLTASAEDVKKILEDFGPIKLKLGGISFFDMPDRDYDVVKFDVISDDLVRLNAALAALPHTDTHPDYHPHATIAYVNNGTGKKYAVKDYWDGRPCPEFTFDKVMFSGKDGDKEHIKLSAKPGIDSMTSEMALSSGQSPSSHIYVGTSGFKFEHWGEGKFYPFGLPRSSWLEYYASKFSTVEIRSTAHNFPETRVIRSWCDKTPSSFIFSLCAPAEVTKIRRLANTSGIMSAFMRRAESFGDRLGAVAFSIPADMPYNGDVLRAFLAELPRGFRYALETRPEAWRNDECLSILHDYNIARIASGYHHRGADLVDTAGWHYIRMLGNDPAYDQGQYRSAHLAEWRSVVSSLSGTTYAYLCNDYLASSANNALELINILGTNRVVQRTKVPQAPPDRSDKQVVKTPDKVEKNLSSPPPQSICPNYFGVPVDQRAVGPDNQTEDPHRSVDDPDQKQNKALRFMPNPWQYLDQYPAQDW